MKAEILKIAGVKDEASFYKKFPTEEAFMAKHGGEFKKAQQGMNLGQQFYQTYNPYFTNNPGQQQAPSGPQNQWNFGNGFNPGNINTPNMPTNFPQTKQAPGIGEQWGNNNPLPEGVQDTSVPENIGWTPQYQTKQPNAGMKALEQLPMVGQIFGGLSALDAEKEQRKAAKQMKMVSDVSLMASNTRPEQIERKYNRPEDNVFSQQEMYPTYGTGTNPLAKNGKKLTKAQTGAAFSGLSSMSGGASATPWGAIGQMGGKMAGTATGDNAGGSIGGGIGGAIGSIWGPAGQAIGKIGGTLIGGLLDKNPKITKRYEQATDRNMQTMAANSQIQSLQSNNSSHMQDGGNMNMNGDLETHWGGEAQPISYNPHLPDGGETVMFRGNSHSQSDGRGNSGIGITYGDNPVEVEGGEPAVVLPNAQGEENLTVFGNLNIPDQFVPILGDDKAKGMKFKNYISQLSKKEEKHNNSLQKSTQEIDTLDMTTPYDKLKFSTLQANILGQNMSLKEIADKKQKASELQAMLNDTAEQHGLSAEHLAKGKIKQAKNGMDIAQAGKTISSNQINDYINKGYKQDPNDPLRLYKPGSASITIKGSPEKQSSSTSVKRNTSSTVHRATRGGGAPNAKWYSWVKQQLNNGVSYEELASKGHGTLQGLKQKFPNEYKATTDNLEVINNQEYTPATKDVSTQSSPGDEVFVKPQNNYETVPYKRSGLIDAYNMILPFIRPTNQEGLHPGQLAGEMYALSSNKVEPVQAQTYQPDLTSPIDVSHQEQMNEIIAQTRAAQRMSQNNPEAQAFIASNAYEAINKVKGKELRDNQEMRFNTFNQNRNTLNDAKLKNLAIFDQQYVRQEQAKSNTKAIAQSALNSMADKYAKNKLENRTLGIQENMYNYRFDKQGRAINFNPLFQANEQSIYSPNTNEPITQVPVKDSKGNIIEYRQVEPQSVSPTLQSPQNYQPILTTAQTTTEYYKPILPGPGVDTSVGTTARRGKTMSKCTNGSIVSSMKRC